MKKTSTQIDTSMTTTHNRARSVGSPKKETLSLIRQFARAYCPVTTIGGIVLN